MARKVEGVATLCFLEDGSGFQGILITAESDQYGLTGRTAKAPKGSYHECCFDEEPQFFVITVIDFDKKKETVVKNVMKTKGDNCSLTCETLKYDTEELYSDRKAEGFIEKYFSKKFLGQNCYVCIGPMEVNIDSSDEDQDRDSGDDDF